MINLAEDASLANEVANLPEVLPRVSWTGESLDLQPLFDNDLCYIIENGNEGCYVLAQADEGSYVVHTLFRPKTSPSVVMETAQEGLWISFIDLDAMEVTSSACETNPAAYRLMRKNGMIPIFDSPSKFKKGKKQRHCRLTIDDYIINSDVLAEIGEGFHKLVEDTTDHEDDPIHDKYVGAVISMVRSGNLEKAIRVYNKWAALAAYAPIQYDEETNSIIAGYMKIQLTDDLQGIGGVSCQ